MARIATIQHISPITARSVIRDSIVPASLSVATVEVSHFSVLRLPGQRPVADSYRKWSLYLDTATAVTLSTGYTIVVDTVVFILLHLPQMSGFDLGAWNNWPLLDSSPSV